METKTSEDQILSHEVAKREQHQKHVHLYVRSIDS